MTQNNPRISPSEWNVLLATWFGTLFDGMDASIYFLTLYPSLAELLNTTSHASVSSVGAIVIAVFMLCLCKTIVSICERNRWIRFPSNSVSSSSFHFLNCSPSNIEPRRSVWLHLRVRCVWDITL